MKTKTYTLIYRIKDYGIISERKFQDMTSADFAERVLHKFYPDIIETLIVES